MPDPNYRDQTLVTLWEGKTTIEVLTTIEVMADEESPPPETSDPGAG
jgi:hypothetical protein